MKMLVVVCALVAVTWVGRSEGFDCSPCSVEDKKQCSSVPTTDDCEQVLDYCGCCTTCAIKENQSCGDYWQRCETGLTCVKPTGPPTVTESDGPTPPTESDEDWWQRVRYTKYGTCTRS